MEGGGGGWREVEGGGRRKVEGVGGRVYINDKLYQLYMGANIGGKNHQISTRFGSFLVSTIVYPIINAEIQPNLCSCTF